MHDASDCVDLVLDEEAFVHWQRHRVHNVLKCLNQLLVCFAIQLANAKTLESR